MKSLKLRQKQRLCLGAVAEANPETKAKPGGCKAAIPATWEAEAGRSQLQGLPGHRVSSGQPWKPSETLFQSEK